MHSSYFIQLISVCVSIYVSLFCLMYCLCLCCSVAEKCKEDITTETLDEVITMLTKVRDDKKKTEAKPKKVTKTKKVCLLVFPFLSIFY